VTLSSFKICFHQSHKEQYAPFNFQVITFNEVSRYEIPEQKTASKKIACLKAPKQNPRSKVINVACNIGVIF